MSEEHDHIVSPRIYVAVLVGLMVLLALTVTAAFVDLDRMWSGPHGKTYWNMAIAFLIAIFKAVLVIMFFMHIKYGSRLAWAFASAAFVWLGIMLTLTLSDYFTRQYPQGTPKSAPMSATPQIIRPQPRHNSVVGNAGDAVSPPGPTAQVAYVDPRNLLVRLAPFPLRAR